MITFDPSPSPEVSQERLHIVKIGDFLLIFAPVMKPLDRIARNTPVTPPAQFYLHFIWSHHNFLNNSKGLSNAIHNSLHGQRVSKITDKMSLLIIYTFLWVKFKVMDGAVA